jgi:D-amino-acid dehydrogenase
VRVDCLVLGAGIVGVSVAVHLARRGRSVVLLDRRAPGEETSFGNAGLIQAEAVHPRAFPREFRRLLRYAGNRATDMVYRPGALPGLAPFLLRYWWHSAPARYAEMARRYAPLIGAAVDAHAELIRAAGADDLIVKQGWYQLYRTAAVRDRSFAEAEQIARDFGIASEQLSGAEMRALEPGLRVDLAGALHWTQPWSIRDPNGLIRAYVRLFEQLGGSFTRGDAATLEEAGGGWRVARETEPIEAKQAAIALGPWSAKATRRLGYRLPLAVKRGYHMHYRQPEDTPLRHWMLDLEPGYLLAPMARGIRLTTGVEFAPLGGAKSPVQLERVEPIGRALFPLGERLDAEPWMGARPATPDMMPIIGPAPRHQNLWFAFGHAHHGMTLGPATGRLIAELMTGEAPFLDVSAFSAARFL